MELRPEPGLLRVLERAHELVAALQLLAHARGVGQHVEVVADVLLLVERALLDRVHVKVERDVALRLLVEARLVQLLKHRLTLVLLQLVGRDQVQTLPLDEELLYAVLARDVELLALLAHEGLQPETEAEHWERLAQFLLCDRVVEDLEDLRGPGLERARARGLEVVERARDHDPVQLAQDRLERGVLEVPEHGDSLPPAALDPLDVRTGNGLLLLGHHVAGQVLAGVDPEHEDSDHWPRLTLVF